MEDSEITTNFFSPYSSLPPSSSSPSSSQMLVVDITSQSLKFKNVAYMKKEQLEKIGPGTAKRNSSSFFLKNKLKMKKRLLGHVMVNAKLILERSKTGWNVEMFHQLFDQESIKQILRISLWKVDQSDRWAWTIDGTLDEGVIALDERQRQFVNTLVGEMVSVTLFDSTYEPGIAELEAVLYTLDKNVKFGLPKLQLGLRERFLRQVMSNGQPVLFHTGAYITITRIGFPGENDELNARGKMTKETVITIKTPRGFNKEINMSNLDEELMSLGMGGIGHAFRYIIHNAFASRFLTPEFCKRLDFNHVRGMILYGPPGTGKTLLVRKLAKILNTAEPKVIKGPELLNQWYGNTEKNVRNLFLEARSDYEKFGDSSPLHIIVFDELDSIARRRGGSANSDLMDSVVNQLLTMIDGFHEMNNMFIFGTTNRLELIDPALMRPGRLELLLEIGAPDEAGRVEILRVHTRKLSDNSLLESDVRLEEIASLTPSWTGADLASLTRLALSNAAIRVMGDTLGHIDEQRIKVNNADFILGIKEFRKTSINSIVSKLETYRSNAILDISKIGPLYESFKKVDQIAKKLWDCKSLGGVTCLLAGPSGCGKTTLAAHIVKKHPFNHVNMVEVESLIQLSEGEKSQKLVEIFENAYKFPSSIIIIDDVERLVGYTEAETIYSNMLVQTLKALLKRPIPKDIKSLVVGITSEESILEKIGISEILQCLEIYSEEVFKAAVTKNISIKRLSLLMDFMSDGDAYNEEDILQFLSNFKMQMHSPFPDGP